MQYNPNTPALELVDLTSDVGSNQEFNRETLHLFCSPLFLKAMYGLYDKNIQTISCGSGKEKGILPGITCCYDTLSPKNKKIAKDMKISEEQFRIGAAIAQSMTIAEFENSIAEIVNRFQQQ